MIKVTVAGSTNIGKTALSQLITDLLRQEGLTVVAPPGLSAGSGYAEKLSEEDLRATIRNISGEIVVLSEKTVIRGIQSGDGL